MRKQITRFINGCLSISGILRAASVGNFASRPISTTPKAMKPEVGSDQSRADQLRMSLQFLIHFSG